MEVAPKRLVLTGNGKEEIGGAAPRGGGVFEGELGEPSLPAVIPGAGEDLEVVVLCGQPRVEGDFAGCAALLHYCEAHNERLIGDAYEEYLVDEVCSTNPADWLAKLSICLA